MIFLTYWFVAFACIAFPCYWLVPNRVVRRWLLLAACVVFHTHFAGPAGVLPIVVLGMITYVAGLTRNKAACAAAIVISAAALIFYKYTLFICQELLGAISPDWKAAGLDYVGPLLPGVPPLAISFFVFEFVHYLVEVCRGGPSLRNPVDFSLFSVFWPSIVAGPVKRYQEFLPAVETGVTSVAAADVALGLSRVALGLVKKIVADNLTAYLTFWGPHYSTFDHAWRWHFLLCMGLRILLDFSGYSDMAIGFGRMHGIRLPENFYWPYLATNLQDFWRRWHISLSSWIRDYIYITLGGGRVGAVRKVFNGLLAFAICGLWHGAGWNFLCWGLLHGVGLAVASNYRSLPGGVGLWLGVWLDRARPVSWLLTMLFVFVSWLFFFYPVPVAWTMLVQLLPDSLTSSLGGIYP